MFHRRLEIGGAELRLLEPHHAEAVFESIDSNRAMLQEWLPWVNTTQSAADTSVLIERQLMKLTLQQELTAGIWLNGNFAGVIGAIFAATSPTAEIGYWLGSKFQGQGLMTAAVRAVIAYLFEERGMHRIEIRCALENHKSRAVPEQLGFKLNTAPQGTNPHLDLNVDHVVYVRTAAST